ncbi:glycosyltransferase [Thalassotalea atypica]|uniref:glycosyltransferase n=1 Tax=Thalassotalea atypica TaxID=2054316 RepID=UPI0025735882|nr:glycosyltransferase family 4 protein [Thalassotalea atypica]
MQKQLLIIGWVWPEPKSSAAGSRMLQLIECFQRAHYSVTFASPAQLTEHMEDLNALDIATKAITLNCASFDEFIGQLDPDVVMFDRYMMEEQFGWRVSKACPNAVRVLDTEDLQSLRNARHQAIKQHQSASEASLNTELAVREVSAIFRSDLSIMISPEEINLLEQHYRVDPSLLVYSPFMFEPAVLDQETPCFDERQHFISIGNFRHAPNWDAVLLLKQKLWPLIRKKLPQAQLHIYGAYPPKKATDLHDEKSGFLVKGWVDDALLAMKNAKVCIAPLRFGAGIKGKLAEAMYCGTPSVTTEIGAEGMHTEHPWAGAVNDDINAMADQAIQLYQDQHVWNNASALGKVNAHLLFDLEQHSDVLIKAFEHVTDNLAQHRANNFTGAMLNHHSHRSTQFMSQWIEAKNKLENEHNGERE